RDPELFVVVTMSTARSESIAEPEAALLRQRVGCVGKSRRSLVGGHHQVGSVAIEYLDPRWMPYAASGDVVSEIQHPADECLVRLDYLLRAGRHAGRRRLDDESALGPYRNDDRVLHRLGLHQVEDLGAEIVGPVAPADSAARDFAGPQMASLHPWTVNVDF